MSKETEREDKKKIKRAVEASGLEKCVKMKMRGRTEWLGKDIQVKRIKTQEKNQDVTGAQLGYTETLKKFFIIRVIYYSLSDNDRLITIDR